MSKAFYWFLLIHCLWLYSNLLGQPRTIQITEIGTPFFDIYAPEQYNAHSQNWDVIQDKNGLMYFANTSGLLIYDDHAWRKIKNPNGNTVSSLCICDDRIYVGMTGEVGYLAPDGRGLMGFVSLKDRLPDKDQNFKALFSARCAGGKVYFQSSYDLFIYDIDQDEFSIQQHDDGYLGLIEVDSSIDAWKSGVGLVTYEGGTARQLLQDEYMEAGIIDMDRLDKDTNLITTAGGFISPVKASIDLNVLPPWWLSNPAFMVYALVVLGGIFLRNRYSKAEKKRLEQVVQDRTGEINARKEKAIENKNAITAQSKKLREMDQIKTRFFSNISHAFRTLIQGPVDAIYQKRISSPEGIRKNLGIARRSIATLRNLIDEILEFNKIKAGNIRIPFIPVNLTMEKDEQVEKSSPLIHGLVQVIESNIDNPNFGVYDLSEEASMSDRQLTRIIKKTIGLTPALLIREVKLQKA